MKIKIFKVCTFFLTCFLINFYPLQRTNLFEPYEWLLDPVRFDCYSEFAGKCAYGVAVNILGEYAITVNGYCGSSIMGQPYIKGFGKRKSNPLHLFTLSENAFAPFLGYDSIQDSKGAFAQQYTLYEGATTDQVVNICGNVGLSQVRIGIEKWINETFRIGWYLPFYSITCDNIVIGRSTNKQQFFEYSLHNPLYVSLSKVDPCNALSMESYSKQGLGDSILLLSWQNNFVEYRNTISSMICAVRGGLRIPSRMYKCDEEDVLLPIPLGYDASWGIVVGGTLEAGVGRYVDLGVAADCTVLMGSLKQRKIKTDIRQTDMLLLQKEQTYLDPGMHQKFDIYFSGHDTHKNLIVTTAYQYNKQHDSDIIVCSDMYSTLVASSTQRLDPWSTHSVLLTGTAINPFGMSNCIVQATGKWGLAGERALVCSTVSLSLVYEF